MHVAYTYFGIQVMCYINEYVYLFIPQMGLWPVAGLDATVELRNALSENVPIPYLLHPFTTLISAIVLSSINKSLIVLT